MSDAEDPWTRALASLAAWRAAESQYAAADDVDSHLALPTAVAIDYVGGEGSESRRIVTLIRIWRTAGIVRFQGRCHLRRAVRTFRAENVIQLVCLATGEAPDDPEAWLISHALEPQAVDHTAQALRAMRDEVAVLAYLARADHRLDPDEVEVIIDHVMMGTDADIDRERVKAQVQRLSVDDDEANEAARRVLKSPAVAERLARSARRLVDADGECCVGEQVAWGEMSFPRPRPCEGRLAFRRLVSTEG